MTTRNGDHWSWGGGSWLFSGFGNTWYNHVHAPNSRSPDCVMSRAGIGITTTGAHTARSHHSGGVHTALADGAVRFISDAIDLDLWRSLGTEDGGEIVGDF
jgi:hypothetical protein